MYRTSLNSVIKKLTINYFLVRILNFIMLTLLIILSSYINLISASGDVAFDHSNTASGTYSVVSCGFNNKATAQSYVIGGGYDNKNQGQTAVIRGGFTNSITSTGSYSSIGGGYMNEAKGHSSTIGGGYDNQVTGFWATISGGTKNVASGYSSAIVGGKTNTATGDYSTILGGYQNTANGNNSFIMGFNGVTNHDHSSVFNFHSNDSFTCNSISEGSEHMCVENGFYINDLEIVSLINQLSNDVDKMNNHNLNNITNLFSDYSQSINSLNNSLIQTVNNLDISLSEKINTFNNSLVQLSYKIDDNTDRIESLNESISQNKITINDFYSTLSTTINNNAESITQNYNLIQELFNKFVTTPGITTEIILNNDDLTTTQYQNKMDNTIEKIYGVLIGINLFLLVVLFALYGVLATKLNKSRSNVSPNLGPPSKTMGM